MRKKNELLEKIAHRSDELKAGIEALSGGIKRVSKIMGNLAILEFTTKSLWTQSFSDYNADCQIIFSRSGISLLITSDNNYCYTKEVEELEVDQLINIAQNLNKAIVEYYCFIKAEQSKITESISIVKDVLSEIT